MDRRVLRPEHRQMSAETAAKKFLQALTAQGSREKAASGGLASPFFASVWFVSLASRLSLCGPLVSLAKSLCLSDTR